MLRVSPSGPVAAEDIRHLERKPSHGGSLEGRQGLDRTNDLPQNIGGHLSTQCCSATSILSGLTTIILSG